MSIEVNGVTLPDIPSEVLEQYPYAVISFADSGSVENYILILTATPIYFIPQAISATLGADFDAIGCWTVGVASARLTVSGGEVPTSWDIQIETSTQLFSQAIPIAWANHDILTVTSVDLTAGTYTTGDIYFPRNDSDPNYYAPKSWYDGMAAQVRRLTGTSEKLTTDEMLEGIKGVEVGGGGSLFESSASGTTS